MLVYWFILSVLSDGYSPGLITQLKLQLMMKHQTSTMRYVRMIEVIQRI